MGGGWSSLLVLICRFVLCMPKYDLKIMDGTMDAIDQISELPPFIIHHIMSYLSAKEVTKTSILSKRWKYLRTSFPILDFDQIYFEREDGTHRNPFLSLREKVFNNQLEEFMNFVDASLRRFCELELSMQKFRLLIKLPGVEESSSRVDEWIRLAVENEVKELELNFLVMTQCRTALYTLPQIIFSAKSINTLKLVGCMLEQPFDGIRFYSLKKLTLEKVYINEEVIHKLTGECPLLEDLFVSNCFGFKHFCVSKALKLNIMEVHESDMDSFEIALPSLQQLTLGCIWERRLQVIDIIACTHLEKLKLIHVDLKDQEFNYIISKFRFLEDLSVDFCKFEQIQISSNRLKKLRFYQCLHLKKIDVDTPNLLSFTYDYSSLPISSINAPCPWNVQLECGYDLDTSWFLILKEFLGVSNQIDHLRIDVRSNKISFTLDKFKESFASLPSQVGNLNLSIFAPSSDYETLLNGFLSICNPKILYVSMNFVYEKEFGMWLYKELRNRDENCCNSCQIKCWRHQFEDYKMSFLESDKDDITLKIIR